MNAKDTENKSSKRKRLKDDPDYSEFVKIVRSNITRLMGTKGLSQYGILDKMSEKFQNVNMDQAKLSKYINAKYYLTAYDLYRIASSLEVSVEELISTSNSCSSNDELNNTVIKNIRLLMSLAPPEISEEKLGEIVGLTQYDVGKCMRGSDTFTLEQISKIADYFSVSLDYLVGRNTYSNDELNNTVIKNIRLLMSLASPEISEEKLGEIVGLTQYDVGICMRGSDTFTLEQISKIADYFSVSVDCLMGRNTYSNFEVCKMISDFIFNGTFAYEIKKKSEDIWEYPCSDRSIYEQVRDQVQHKKDEGISFYKFIESRIDEETTPDYVKHSNIIDYLTFYLPMCKKLSDDEDYYDDLLEFETFGNLNSDNVIINHFLKEFTNALKLKETGIINEDEFKRRVNDVFREVMQLSLCEKKTKLRSLFFPEFKE